MGTVKVTGNGSGGVLGRGRGRGRGKSRVRLWRRGRGRARGENGDEEGDWNDSRRPMLTGKVSWVVTVKNSRVVTGTVKDLRGTTATRKRDVTGNGKGTCK